jgi:hypothetical protein
MNSLLVRQKDFQLAALSNQSYLCVTPKIKGKRHAKTARYD